MTRVVANIGFAELGLAVMFGYMYPPIGVVASMFAAASFLIVAVKSCQEEKK